MNDFIKEMYESYKGKFIWHLGEWIYIGDPNDKEMYEKAVKETKEWCNKMKQQINQWEKQLKKMNKPKQINRTQLRGKPMEFICKSAKVCSEMKDGVKICFCYGVNNLMDDEPIGQCKECKAYYKNINW